jgi:protein-S-isoprenylcysteine O-methyltransferase Ste14
VTGTGASRSGWCYCHGMSTLHNKASGGLLFLLLVMAARLFIPAWTLDYWQAWMFLAVYFASSLAITLYLMKKDPGLLQRRGIPIALGSWWGVLIVVAMMPALIWRLFDEEKFLAGNLPGYVEYQNKVGYRLIPLVW